MLYPKNKTEKLDVELFKKPTAEYRGTPFWSWNTDLKKEELLWQIERLKEMGFGGYHMHVRAGMSTPYLSEEFMDLIKACVEKGNEEQMLSWLYDEDRWPSGFAGGIVTKDPRFRTKYIQVTKDRRSERTSAEEGYKTGKPYFIAVFDVKLNELGELSAYKRIGEDDEPEGDKWYVYLRARKPNGRFNNQTYVDTMDSEAIKEFIDVTYVPYKNTVGEHFGKSVPAIFTDEPQVHVGANAVLTNGFDTRDTIFAWTTTFDDSFKAAYGYSILDKVPELMWNLEDNAPSQARYHYYDHVTERFVNAFADQCGKWCDENGIALTGHLMQEGHLELQSKYVGEAMRSYRGFGIPGIDMLCDAVELSTAKQTQSAVHQYGKEAMLSELYGVTGWGFDFRGHKFQGDWQAALGVTVRVHHLSWVSMRGSAKRDYPASIHYQSAWYDKYNYVEDHFARLNTALTRGKPIVNIALLHPIESYWLNLGPNDSTASAREDLERTFQQITRDLLSAGLDFDYFSESLLPELHKSTDKPVLTLGEMSYSAVVIPPIYTIRKSTVDALLSFVDRGGKVIFTGDCPIACDGIASDYAKTLYERSVRLPFSKIDIVKALEDEREVRLINSDGSSPDNFLYNLRRDGDGKWLFVTRFVKPGTTSRFYDPATNAPHELSIRIKGHYRPTVYDTVSGETYPISFSAKDGYTTLSKALYASDSLLLWLEDCSACELVLPKKMRKVPTRTVDFKKKVPYSLTEPNVMVLDMCSYSMDGESWSETEEILRIDKELRAQRAWPMASGQDCQPWCIEKERIDTFPYLKFEFDSEICAPVKLAFEYAEEILFNGQRVPLVKDGYYVDKEIYTVTLPELRLGRNTLLVKVPISGRVSLENMYLLGDFGVKVSGAVAEIVERDEDIAFGSITGQGMPFYGAGVTYYLPLTLERDSDVTVRASLYSGAVIDVSLDGVTKGKIAYAPFTLELNDLPAGEHTVALTLYATRVNTFGALHDCVDRSWKGPNMYYSEGEEWSYEYNLSPVGILKSAELLVYEK